MSQAWLAPQSAETARALPACCYVDPAFEAHDRGAVLAPSWQLVAHVSRLAERGDHVVADVAGVPVIVLHDGSGIRAFHNVCRHRAGPLAHCDGRGLRALRCRYHGWTYRFDGALASAPEMETAVDFAVDSVRLPEVAIEVREGLVYAALGAAPPIDEVLAGIAARLAPTDLSSYRHARRASYDIACNWKAYVDNYLEGYHLPHVHPALNRALDYRSYDTELAAWHSLQSSPLETDAALYGEGEALYYFVYPNTMLNILPGRLQTNRVLPLGPARCRVEFDYYYAPGRDPAAVARDADFSDEVQHEDVAICEAVQRGLLSGSYHAGRLNPKRERGVLHFHELLRAAYRTVLERGSADGPAADCVAANRPPACGAGPHG